MSSRIDLRYNPVMKVTRLAVLLSVVVVSAIGIEAYMAQESNSSPETSQGQVTQSAEPAKDATLSSKLSTLLSKEGVRVESSLLNLDSQAYRELRVRWQSSVSAVQDGLLKQAGPGAVTLLNSFRKEGRLPRDRALEPSSNQILMIATDAEGKLRWWKLSLDPRLIRAEVPAVTGELKGEEYYLKSIDFVVTYPDEAGITEVRLYHPHWTGKEVQLELISRLAVN